MLLKEVSLELKETQARTVRVTEKMRSLSEETMIVDVDNQSCFLGLPPRRQHASLQILQALLSASVTVK